MYNNLYPTSSKGLFTKAATDQEPHIPLSSDNEPPKRISWSATFVSCDPLNNRFTYRRLHFKNLRNSKGEVVEKHFSIDESAGLQAIGPLSYGEIINFTTDLNFKDIIFCYPHGKHINYPWT